MRLCVLSALRFFRFCFDWYFDLVNSKCSKSFFVPAVFKFVLMVLNVFILLSQFIRCDGCFEFSEPTQWWHSKNNYLFVLVFLLFPHFCVPFLSANNFFSLFCCLFLVLIVLFLLWCAVKGTSISLSALSNDNEIVERKQFPLSAKILVALLRDAILFTLLLHVFSRL